jgi:hypothetical protein
VRVRHAADRSLLTAWLAGKTASKPVVQCRRTRSPVIPRSRRSGHGTPVSPAESEAQNTAAKDTYVLLLGRKNKILWIRYPESR